MSNTKTNTKPAALNKPYKATMLIQNTMGATVARHITITHELLETNTDVTLCYKTKGARKAKGWRISKRDTQLIICEGWVALEGLEQIKNGEFMLTSFTSFDKSEFNTIAKQIGKRTYTHLAA